MSTTNALAEQQRWMTENVRTFQEDPEALAHAQDTYRSAIQEEARTVDRSISVYIWAGTAFSLITLAIALALMTSVAQSSAPWAAMLVALPVAFVACAVYPRTGVYGYVIVGFLYPLSALTLVATGAGVFAGASLGIVQLLVTVSIGLAVVAVATETLAWCLRRADAEKSLALPIAVYVSGSLLSLAVSVLWAYQSM